jgi:hypothetical protein
MQKILISFVIKLNYKNNLRMLDSWGGKYTLSRSVKSQPHKWHIWFFPTHKPTLKKPKEPFFANAPTNRLTIIQTVFIFKNEIVKILKQSLRTHFKMT